MFHSEFCKVSKSAFFTKHLRWLLLWFILVASIVVTWGSWFSGRKYKLEAGDFIFQILQRNFPNVGVKLLALWSAKSIRSILFFLKLFSVDIYLFKVWLKRSQNEYIFSFYILKCHITVQTNWKNELFFKGEHSYK